MITGRGARQWWIRPHHTRWLVACLMSMGVAAWAGEASLGMVSLFAVIFAVGAALIALDGRTDADLAEHHPATEGDEAEPGEAVRPSGESPHA